MSDEAEPDERIERTDVGASLEVSITRGTGTRDQEKYKAKGKGETAERAIAELRRELAEIFPVDDEEPIGEQVRAFQPEIDDDADGADGDGDDDDA